MAKPKKSFDTGQKKKLTEFATAAMKAFYSGLVLADDPHPLSLGENGISIFPEGVVRLSSDFRSAQTDFTHLAAKMLKAKSAHEKTIRSICLKAGQKYVKARLAADDDGAKALSLAADHLVNLVLAEAGREYVHIEPNYLVKHDASDLIALGRVRSMRTELAATNTILSKNPGIQLAVTDMPEQTYFDKGTTLGMPASVWVVDVAATKENVAEEAKWLIDVGVSFMRLSAKEWPHHFPKFGELEAHPTYPTLTFPLHVTMEEDTAYTGGGTSAGFYVIDAAVASQLGAEDVQTRANSLFDPPDRSLAQRVAQGLGWLTRGRQASDRSERLLSFFTAVEALLTSNDKNDPVTQTISRHASVIYTQDIKDRIAVFNRIKALYALRSSVVHAGRRDVLWQDANTLQSIIEAVFWVVLHRCDLTMTQERFAQSLSDASHGSRWEFAAPPQPDA